MLFYVYVLESLKDYQRYVGYTGDLKRRLKEHKEGKSFLLSFIYHLNLFTLKPVYRVMMLNAVKGILKLLKGEDFWVSD